MDGSFYKYLGDHLVSGIVQLVVVAVIIAALLGLGIGYAIWGPYTLKASVKVEQRR
mgnify:CR=1 FL=1